MADKYRSQIFRVSDSGAYVQVFQRPGEDPKIDCNFFDGNRTLPESIAQFNAYIRAINQAADWKKEDAGEEVLPMVETRLELLLEDG